MAVTPSEGNRLDDFPRQPVHKKRLLSSGYFSGTFTGEYIAATDFVIGALFVTWGVGVRDVLVGLSIGNLLAVLCWALVCAPLAVQTRLTLSWYFRKIGGPAVAFLYNLLNAAFYAILAGGMITVAASAARIPFGIKPQTGWIATDPWFYPVVVGVGALVVWLAMSGFKRIAQCAKLCSPWLLVMCISGAFILLPQLGHIASFEGFFRTLDEQVWTGPAPRVVSCQIKNGRAVVQFGHTRKGFGTSTKEGVSGFQVASASRGGEPTFVDAEATIDGTTVIVSSAQVAQPALVAYNLKKNAGGNLIDGLHRVVPAFRSDQINRCRTLGLWHIAGFAWLVNLAMHLGLSDMALFRYAKRGWYGLFSSCGMFFGHYLVWICAGVMGAAVATMMSRPIENLDSGEIAFRALGLIGAFVVVIAGWTTSTPALYRAGLALQAASPGWPRWLVTLVAGVVTMAVACSPFVFRELIGFVVLFGLVLLPIGAIVVVEHWLFGRLGMTRFWSARKGQFLNWPALVSWGIALSVGAYCWKSGLIHEFFLAGPIWILTAVLYIVFSLMAGARQSLPELKEPEPEEPEPVPLVELDGSKPTCECRGENVLRVLAVCTLLISGIVAVVLFGLVGRDVLTSRALVVLRTSTHVVLGASFVVALYLHEKRLPFTDRLYVASRLVSLFCLGMILLLSVCVFACLVSRVDCLGQLGWLTLGYFISGLIVIRQGEKRFVVEAAEDAST